MTVENTSNKKRFLGDGVTDEVTFNFRVLSASDIKVYVYPEALAFDDLEDYLVSPNDYTIALEDDGEGGTITFDPGVIPAADEIGLLVNVLALTQTADLPTEGNFNEVAVETALDRLVMQNIQQQEQMNRGLSLRQEDPLVDDVFTGIFIEAVEAADRAARIMQFNATGDGVEAGMSTDELSDLAALTDEIAALAAITAEIVIVAGIAANVTTVAGIAASVSTVAGISAHVVTVSGISAAVSTVAGISANVTTVAGISAAVSTVAGISASVSTVAGISANVTTVAGISASVTTVAGISADVSTVAGISAAVSTVAANIADIQNAEENANIAKAAAGFTYTYSTTTAAADPGAGVFRLNNADLTLATALYISETTGLAQAIAAELATWDDSTSTVHGKLRIFKQADPSIFRIYDVTGALVDNGTWDTLTVAHVAGNGAWANNDVMTVQYLRTGDKGDVGPAGSLDFTVLAAETAPDTADLAVINDVSEGAGTNNKITLNNLWKVVNTFTAETSVDTADVLSLYDASAGTADKCTVNELFRGVNTFAALTAVDTADVTNIYDTSAGTALKATVNEVFKAVNSFTAETSVDSADVLPLYDASAGTADKCTVAELFKSVNTLTADGAPDLAADYALVYDASAAAAKKVLLNLIGAAAASQADQETSTSTTTYVSPGRQQFHPSAAKFWVRSPGSSTMTSSYNMTSITDNGVGIFNLNIATDFSNANYTFMGMATQSSDVGTSDLRSICYDNGGGTGPLAAGVLPVSTKTIATGSGAIAAVDCIFGVVGFGDQ
jgi:hypothetical protein